MGANRARGQKGPTFVPEPIPGAAAYLRAAVCPYRPSSVARAGLDSWRGTVRYLGVEVDDALSISEQVEL